MLANFGFHLNPSFKKRLLLEYADPEFACDLDQIRHKEKPEVEKEDEYSTINVEYQKCIMNFLKSYLDEISDKEEIEKHKSTAGELDSFMHSLIVHETDLVTKFENLWKEYLNIERAKTLRGKLLFDTKYMIEKLDKKPQLYKFVKKDLCD